MKWYKIIFVSLFLLIAFASCNDLDAPDTTTTENSFEIFNPIDGTTYTLDESNEEAAFETFLWGPSTISSGEITYDIEFSSDDFVTFSALSTGSTTAYKASIGEMITVFRDINVASEVLTEVKARVVASSSSLTDTSALLAFDVKRYAEDDEGWFIQGSATNDSLYSLEFDSEVIDFPYSIRQDLVVGEFQFIDTDGNALGVNSSGVGLVINGDGISITEDGDYSITADFDALEYTISQNETWYIMGSATGNALLEMDYDGSVWTASERLSIGNYIFVEKYGAIYGVVPNSDSIIVVDGDSITVTETENYMITLDILNLVYDEEVTAFPSKLYMTGASVGSGAWDWETNGIELTPVNSQSHLFWNIQWLEPGVDDAGFKFSPELGWDPSFGVDPTSGIDGIYDRGTENVPEVSTSGYYTIVVNLLDQTIEVNPSLVYGIGLAFGSWDAATPDYLFTEDVVDKKLVSPAVGTTENVRMHVASTILTDVDGNAIEWWQAEFNVFDGVIEYRGTGDDQEVVPIVAGQSVYLDFINETGEIK